MRGMPFTSVCNELCALKNWECWKIAGAVPGTRFSRDWKLRLVPSGIRDVARVDLGTDVGTIGLEQWRRGRNENGLGDAAGNHIDVNTRGGVAEDVDVLMRLFLEAHGFDDDGICAGLYVWKSVVAAVIGDGLIDDTCRGLRRRYVCFCDGCAAGI